MTSNLNENTRLWQLQGDERSERIRLPWRRMMARAVDFLICLLLWWAVTYLGFHCNVLLLHWLPCSALIIAITLVVMIVLEPIIIALFGATPGKALLNIRVGKAQGGKLSVGESYARTLRVFARGCGYVVIPVYNFIKIYQAWKDCQVEGKTEWDENISYTVGGNFGLQTLLSVISALLALVLLASVYFAADMPRRRGDLTATQLEENLEDYWRFHGTAWNTELFYTVNLQFYEMSAGYIFDRMTPPEVVLEERNGVVTGVSFEFEDESRMVLMALPVWLRGYTVAFVGAQSDIGFLKMHAPSGVLDVLLDPVRTITNNRSGKESINFTVSGVEVSLDMFVDENVSVSFSLRVV